MLEKILNTVLFYTFNRSNERVHYGDGGVKSTNSLMFICFLCLNHLGSQTVLINLNRQIANQFSFRTDFQAVL